MERPGGFLKIPQAFIDSILFENLPGETLKVLMVLARYMNWHTGIVEYTSRQRLANQTQISTRSLSRHLFALCHARLLTVIRAGAGRETAIYQINLALMSGQKKSPNLKSGFSTSEGRHGCLPSGDTRVSAAETPVSPNTETIIQRQNTTTVRWRTAAVREKSENPGVVVVFAIGRGMGMDDEAAKAFADEWGDREELVKQARDYVVKAGSKVKNRAAYLKSALLNADKWLKATPATARPAKRSVSTDLPASGILNGPQIDS